MVFSTTTLFKNIACPAGEKCNLTSCIYSHEKKPSAETSVAQTTSISNVSKSATTPQQPPPEDDFPEPASKRRKVTYDTLADKPPSRADIIRNRLANVKKSPLSQSHTAPSQSSSPNLKSQPPVSLSKPVTPPPTNGKATSTSGPKVSGALANKADPPAKQPGTLSNGKIETLNPRLINNDPVGHPKRQNFLKHLHMEMVRLNTMLCEAPGLEQKHLLRLDEQELIKFALDSEEKVARDTPQVYSNVIKQRIAALRKMPLEKWIEEVKMGFGKGQPEPAKKIEKPIETGLLFSQEHLVLPHLLADQKPLAAHGYIPVPPTAEQAAEAAAAVVASQNWEVCDRCTSRFQVFPDRNEEGQLTANGPCYFHPLRKVYPQRQKTDRETGSREPYYPCCSNHIGAPGCTRHDHHVFKASSPARLAAVLPFETTPENPSPRKDSRGRTVQAVTFDCEMGYTTKGLELIRLTAVSWPYNEQLVDVLVRPVGAIIDLNSRFSGIFPEDYTRSIPYEKWADYTPPPPVENERPRLPLVAGPAKARELLCSYLSPKTPLMGHAIDNDLNTVRLCHPTIVDTVLLFPHPRGLPMRFGLKNLSERHLHRSIQNGGERGHDSLEDAIATGDLVRVKVAQKWKELRITKWQIVNGNQLIPPPPLKTGMMEKSEDMAQEHANRMVDRAVNGSVRKRKKGPSTDGADESGSDEDEPASGNGDI
ncbi:RNA exonuclease 3 [Pseudocercospora fuligena]|uniref:RNA exonuclease 3 n=1 Tax=Pseudocercospora fuligena TaxID=685502 RepID=A0A8H6RA90_9PEZI|nr:RNA exonuclease 3 [Pseudocercospora fuligena]